MPGPLLDIGTVNELLAQPPAAVSKPVQVIANCMNWWFGEIAQKAYAVDQTEPLADMKARYVKVAEGIESALAGRCKTLAFPGID